MSRYPIYSDALRKSGFHDNITFIPKTTNTKTNKKKTRKRKIIWFNPPYCLSVKTNVGKIFLKLIKKHFLKGNSLNKIFNKNTIKVSYSCMANISSILSLHKKNILNPVSNTEYGCNCRSKESWPQQNKFLAPKIVYRADVKNLTNHEKKVLTTRGTSNTANTEIAQSYQNIYGNSKMLIYHQKLNEYCYKSTIKNTIKFS